MSFENENELHEKAAHFEVFKHEAAQTFEIDKNTQLVKSREKDDFHYVTVSEIMSLFKYGFLGGSEESMSRYGIDTDALTEVSERVYQRKLHYKFNHYIEWEELKEAASICFWLTRLKPIAYIRRSGEATISYRCCDVNERLGLYILFSAVNEYRAECGLPKIDFEYDQSDEDHPTTTLYDDILYFLQYRITTQEAVLAVAESLAKSFPIDFQPAKIDGTKVD
jgi:hypothetical protein